MSDLNRQLQLRQLRPLHHEQRRDIPAGSVRARAADHHRWEPAAGGVLPIPQAAGAPLELASAATAAPSRHPLQVVVVHHQRDLGPARAAPIGPLPTLTATANLVESGERQIR